MANSRFVIPLLFLLLVSFVLHFLSFFIVGSLLNFICLLSLFALSFFWLAFIKSLWVYFVYVFAFCFASLSGFFIEYSELYMFEIRENGRLTGAVATASSLMSIFLGVSFFSCFVVERFNFSLRRLGYFDGLMLYVLVRVAFVLLVLIFGVVFLYGSPLFLGVDRFTFWSDVAPPGVGKVRYFLVFLSFVVAYAHVVGRLRFSTAVAWLALSLVGLILNGEKLSGLLLIMYFYLVPYFFLGKKSFPVWEFLGWGSACSVVFIFIVIGNYFMIQGEFGAAIDIFFSRLALQGQMNYAIFNNATGHPDFSNISSAFFGVGVETYQKGIYYFMDLVAPADVVERRLQQGTTFTAPFPSNFFYFFGYFSFAVSVFCAVFVGVISAFVSLALRSRNFIFSFVSIAASYYMYGAVVMGNMHKLFEWKFFLMLGALVVMLVLGGLKRERYFSNSEKEWRV